MSWWWMSFVGEQGFLGVCIVEAETMEAAVASSHMIGCNPGGDIHVLGIPPEFEAETFARFQPNRLITEEELRDSKWAVRVGDAVKAGYRINPDLKRGKFKQE